VASKALATSWRTAPVRLSSKILLTLNKAAMSGSKPELIVMQQTALVHFLVDPCEWNLLEELANSVK
jgi:hypothetical protein